MALLPDYSARWSRRQRGNLDDGPNWLLPEPNLWRSAKEDEVDNKWCQNILLGALKLQTGGPELWDNLLPLLWGWTDSSAFSNAMLRRASGLKIAEVREVAETSELGAQYKCLKCREPLETCGRDQYELRRVALASFLAHRRGTHV